MKEIESIVVDEVHQILPHANAMACGSYRRGKETSGDCDILITDPDEEECGMLPGTVFIYPDLFRSQILFIRATRTSSRFITGIAPDHQGTLLIIWYCSDDLKQVSDHHLGRCDSYMGVCRVNEV